MFRALALLTLLSLGAAAAAQTPSFTGLGAPPGAATSTAEAIDATGSVVVGVIDQTWPPGEGRPARWSAGAWDVLPLPFEPLYGQALGAVPTGVSASGAVVTGMAQFTDGSHSIPQPTGIAIWDAAGVSVPEVGSTVASAGVSDGEIRTAWGDDPTTFSPLRAHARAMADGVIVTLPDLDPAHRGSFALAISRDGGTIVGWSITDLGRTPCRWVEAGGVWEIHPLRSAGEPLRMGLPASAAVSPDGQWIALVIDVGGRSKAPALWHDGVLEWLAPASEDFWELTAASEGGAMITGWGPGGPLVWDRRNGIVGAPAGRYLESRHRLSLDGWTITHITDLTADGRTLIGTGRSPAGVQEGWIARLGDSCYADCDGSGLLDFFDFLCFQNEFAAGAPGADCNVSGLLDLFDFLCFQDAFAAGCP